MKSLKCILYICSALIFFSPSNVTGNPYTKNQYDTVYVVVIGAFFIHKNAEQFTIQANKQGVSAKLEYNSIRNLYYVFTLSTYDRLQAIAEAQKFRAETVFPDAWVYKGPLGGGFSLPKKETVPQQTEPVSETIQPELPIAETKPEVKKEEGKKFIFELYRANDNKPVKGKVNVINKEQGKKITSYESNTSVLIESPPNKPVTLVSDVFGFRKVQRDLNLSAPEGEKVVTNENNETVVVIPFELVQLQRGDIEVMYNVFFFKDAAVMMPESQFEVNNLLDMMKSNPKVKIRIHGHTNGNGSGKIISMGEPKNFFSLSGTKEGFGSAKQLSEERATAIKAYLIENGIDQSRMEVKAWGGKRALYDKESAKAKENVRVEIEILEE